MREVGYQPKGADTGRLWTPALWNKVPWNEIEAKSRDGVIFFDDFTNMPAFGAVDEDSNLYACYSDAGSTFGQITSTDLGGALRLTTDASDNDEGWIQTGGNTAGLANFVLQGTGAPHILTFECRVKKSSITVGSFFVGLAEPGLAAVDTIADAGTIADKDYIGFFCPEADMDGIDAVYNETGGTNPNILIADYHTVVADTYVKLGFQYDARNISSEQISFWKNGVKSSTFITKAIIDDTDEFPGDTDLALLFGGKNNTTTGFSITMDWWRLAVVPTG